MIHKKAQLFFFKLKIGPMALLLALFVCLCPCAAYAEEAVLTITSAPATQETVYAGDTISYTVSVGKDGEVLHWTWLRITLQQGLALTPDSILLDCADEMPPDTQENAATSKILPTPMPVTHDVVLGNDGFVLLTSALLAGDTITFDAVVQEDAPPILSAQTELTTISVAHMLGVSTVATPAPTTPPSGPAFTPPAPLEATQTQQRPSLWLYGLLACICTGGLVASVYFISRAYRTQRKSSAAIVCKQPPEQDSSLPEKVQSASEETQAARNPNITPPVQTQPDAQMPSAAIPVDIAASIDTAIDASIDAWIDALIAAGHYGPAPVTKPEKAPPTPVASRYDTTTREKRQPAVSVEDVLRMAETYKQLVAQYREQLDQQE